MKEYWQKFKEWYAALEQRERRAVNIGGTALLIAIFYFGIWSPFLGRVDALRKRITSEQKTLAWMREADQKIQTLSGNNTPAREASNPVALLALMQDKIADANLQDALKDMKQAGNDAIQLQFKNVSFDQLMNLLIDILKNSRVSISHFSAVAEKSKGMVNADITLTIS